MKVNSHKESVELSQLGKNKKAGNVRGKEAEASAAPGVSIGDTTGVSISDEAKAMATANQTARADTTDQAKIDRIKAMINGGTYKPDFGKVADKMVNETLLQETT